MSKWQWILRQFSSKLWLRAGLFCILGIVTALTAAVVSDSIPVEFSQKVGAEAVDNLLQIIANSMLVVTTFSLSTMVAAYTAATANVTPRATQLLLRDSTAQNALSVFIGAFLFSLVGIIALSMEIYGESGRVILYFVTIIVITLIIGVLLQWISYLSRLGRVGETIDLIEKAASDALQQYITSPFIGGTALRDYTPSPKHYPIRCDSIGYLQHVDMKALSQLAETLEADFFLCMIPGTFNDGTCPLFYSTVKLDDKKHCVACKAYSIGNERSFDQDPRFGMVVMAEIASRALSPAVNDAGTAIDVIDTSVRILSPWVTNRTEGSEPDYPRLHVPPLKAGDLLDDIYATVIRDTNGNLQLAVKVQKALASLARLGNRDVTPEIVKLSKYGLAYADGTLLLQSDKDVVAALARKVVEAGENPVAS